MWECHWFRDIIDSERLIIKQYEPPKIHIVGGLLFEDNFDHVKGNIDTQFQKYFSTYGMPEMGDGETIVNMLMFNVLASTYVTSPVFIRVHDYSRYIEGGRHRAGEGKTDAEYISKIFLPEMERLDPEKNRFDLFIVDVASTFQCEGGVVEAVFPLFHNIHK